MAVLCFKHGDILLIARRQQMVWLLWRHELQHNAGSPCTAWCSLKLGKHGESGGLGVGRQ